MSGVRVNRQVKNEPAEITLIPGTFRAATQCRQSNHNKLPGKRRSDRLGKLREGDENALVTGSANRHRRQQPRGSGCFSAPVGARCWKGRRNGRELVKVICNLCHRPLSAARRSPNTFARSNENGVIFILYSKDPGRDAWTRSCAACCR